MKPHTPAHPPALDPPDGLDDATLAVRLATLDALADELAARPHLPPALRATLIEQVLTSQRAHTDERRARLRRPAARPITPVVGRPGDPVTEAAPAADIDDIAQPVPTRAAAPATAPAAAARVAAPAAPIAAPAPAEPTDAEAAEVAEPAEATAPAEDTEAAEPAESAEATEPAADAEVAAPPEAAEPTTPRLTPTRLLPEWVHRLRPAAAENLMYLLGGFLVVAGAIYFASTAWTTMSGAARLLLLDGGLVTLGALLIGVGRLLTRRFAEEPAGRHIRGVTAHLAAGLTPIAAVVAGRLLLTSPLTGAIGLAGVLAAGAAAHAFTGGRAPDRRRATTATLAITLGAALIPLLPGTLAVALIAGVLVGAAAFALPHATPASAVAQLGGATAALVAHAGLATGSIAAGAVALPALALGLARITRTRPAALAVLALALLAIAPAFAEPRLVPLACLLATLTAAAVTLRLGAAPLWALPLVLSLIAYVTAPAPVAELVAMLRDAFAASLGYTREPLPLAWYGLTCLPYLAALAWVDRRLTRAGQPRMAALTAGWTMLVALALCGLAIASTDLRAPLAVLAAEGLTLIGVGALLGRRGPLALGALAITGAAGVLAAWRGWPIAAAVLVAEVALGLLWIPLRRLDPVHRRVYGWAAASPLVLLTVGLHLTAFERAPDLLLLVAPLPLAALCAHRGRTTGHPLYGPLAALLAMTAAITAARLLALPADAFAPLVAAVALAAAVLHRALRAHAPAPAPRALMPIGLAIAVFLALSPAPLDDAPTLGWALAALLAAATCAQLALRLHVPRAAAPAVLTLIAAPPIALAALGLADRWIALATAVGALGVMVTTRHFHKHARLRRVTTPAVLATGLAAAIAVTTALFALPSRLDPLALLPLAVAFAALAAAPRARSLLHPAALALPAIAGLAAASMVFTPHQMVIALCAAPLAYALLALIARTRPLLDETGRHLPTAALTTAALLLPAVLFLRAVDPQPPTTALALYALLGLCCAVARDRHPRASHAARLAAAAAALAGPIALDLLGLSWPWLPTFALALLTVAAFSERLAIPRVVGALAAAGFALALHAGALQQDPAPAAFAVPLALALACGWHARRGGRIEHVALAALLLMSAAVGALRLAGLPLVWIAPLAPLVAVLVSAAARPARALPVLLTAAVAAIAALTAPHWPLSAFAVHPAWLATALALAALWTHAALRHDTPAIGAPAALALIAAAPIAAALAGLDGAALFTAPALVALPLVAALARVDHPRAPAAIRAAALLPIGPALLSLTQLYHGPDPWLLAPALGALATLALTPARHTALHRAALILPLIIAIHAAALAHSPLGLIAAPLLYLALDHLSPRVLPGLARAAARAALLSALALVAFAPALGLPRLHALALIALCAAVTHPPRLRHPILATLTRLTAAVAAIAVIGTPAPWPPIAGLAHANPWPPIAALALLIAAVHLARPLGLHRATTRALAALAGAVPALLIAASTLPRLVHLPPDAFVAPLPAAPALALTLAALAATLVPRRHRARALLIAAVPLVALHPLATALFHTPAAPALELAALALIAARLDRRLTLPLAALALIATGGLYRDPATPLTLTLLAAAPVLALPRPKALEPTLYALAAAATAWLICLVPSSGNSPLEILPPIAALLTTLALAPRLLPAPLRAELAPALPRVHLTLGALATLALAANLATRHAHLAPAPVALCAALAALTLVALALHRALTRTDPRALDLALGLFALGHAWIAHRVHLPPLDGHHLLLLAALGPILRTLGALGDLTVRLRRRALLLPLPALVLYLPDHTLHALACLLAAATYGLALPDRRRLATWTNLALLLAAAARLALAHDVVDPTVYGLPAGLALLLGAHLDRAHLGPRHTSVLQLIGLSIAWITTAAQIIRLDSPTHAILLFALALATVALGWIRHRSDLLIAGAVALICDVTLHLLQTGFARGFLGAAGLVAAGAILLAIAARHTRSRARPDT